MRKLTLSLAILAAMMPGRGYPLGLGEIELNSALNQDLDAEVEVLSAQPEDAEQLIIKLASREAFARAGIDRPYLLQQLKFKVITRNGKSFVKIITKKPVREPFLSFLVEIDWPQGHLLREYTLLLDPPVYTGVTTTSSSSSSGDERPFIDPADQSKNQSVNTDVTDEGRPAESAFDSAATTHSSGVVAPAVVATKEVDGSVTYTATPQHTEASGEYRVKANDTLWSLSNRMRPDSSVSVEQMMLALVKKNPEAFIEENINGLKRGYILRMPDQSAIASVDRQQALAQVREHATLWRQYREAQSGVVPASSLESKSDGVATDAVTDSAVDGQLSIVSASETDGSDTASTGQDLKADEIKQLRNQLSLARETIESERLEKDDLRTRLADLEQRVQNVLQMDEAELAKLQQDLKGTQQEIEAPVEEVVVEEAVIPEEIVTEIEVPADELVTEEIIADETIEEKPVEGEQAFTEEGAEKAEDEVLFVDEAADTEEQPIIEQELVTEPVEQMDVPEFAQPKKPKTFIEQLFDDPSMLAAIGGGLLGVFALIGVLLRRRRVNKGDDEWAADDELGGLGDLAEEVDAEATIKAEAVDLDATAEMPATDDSMPNFDDTQIEAPVDDMDKTVISLDDELAEPVEEIEQDDVLAEADVYLAYGIYQQAEELLKNAINQNPERDDYRMKLLETHFAGKDSAAFSSLAVEMHQRKGSDKAYWDRVVTMGRDLCPENELFTGAAVPELNAEDLLPEKPQTTDLELDAGDETGAPDLDLGLDEDLSDSDATHVLDAPVDLDMGLAEDTAEATESDEMGDLLGDSELEFDLGDFGEEPEETSDSVEEPLSSEESLDTEMAGLDESLDIGDLEVDLGEDLEASLQEGATGDDLDIDEDFSLDFEASDLGFDEEELVADEAESEAADTDIDLAIDMEAGTEVESESEVITDADDLDMDLGSVDVPESISEDDSSVDFDVSSLSDDVDEISTKLDLAKAYIDMGDNEGARSILEEVKQEGNDEQQQQADELLKQAS